MIQGYPIIEFLEAKDFKSFKGLNKFGPLSSTLNAVVGPVGSGKSNFVEAVRFVMGEDISAFCGVEGLSQLSHGACIDEETTAIPSVTVVLSLNRDGPSKRKFTRTIAGPEQSEYMIDNQVVDVQHYMDALVELGISAAAKNFTVSESIADVIALKDSSELCEWLQEISGSKTLEDPCKHLEEDALKKKEYMEKIYELSAAKVKRGKIEDKNTEKYENIMKKITEFLLFSLFYNQSRILSLDGDIVDKKSTIRGKEETLVDIEEIVNALKGELDNALRELADIEQPIPEMENLTKEKMLSWMREKEHVEFIKKKLITLESLLGKLEQEDRASGEVIESLEKALVDVKAEEQSYKNELAADESRVVQLGDAQVEEYKNLKMQAQVQSANDLSELDSITREQNADQDEIDFIKYQKADLKVLIDGKSRRKEELENTVEKLTERISTSENTLSEHDRMYESLGNDIGSLRNRIPSLQSKLVDIVEQLEEIQVNTQDENTDRLQIEDLRTLRLGVHDRVAKMVQPISSQYTLATNKLLSQYSEAIIVDNEFTALWSVEYLENRRLAAETFLPIKNLRTEPLRKSLREIRVPRGVKVMFDVLKFDPVIEQVALFLTDNALVCGTIEDALRIWGLGGKHHTVVTVNGVMFEKSGIISYSSPDSTCQSPQRSNPKQSSGLTELELDEENILNELHEALKQVSRKESEIASLESLRQALMDDLQDLKYDRDLASGQIRDIEEEIRELKQKSSGIDACIEEIGPRMFVRELKLKKLEELTERIEDQVFVDFCGRTGVSMSDLRRYEKYHESPSSYRDRVRQCFELKTRKNRIVNQLNFEQQVKDSRNEDIQRWRRARSALQEELVRSELAEEREAKEKGEYEDELGRLHAIAATKNIEVDSKKLAIKKAEDEADKMAREIRNLRKALLVLENEVEKTRWVRYNILEQANGFEDVTIPFLLGSIEEVVDLSIPAQSMHDRLSRLVIDYSSLPDELRNLRDSDKVREKEFELAKIISDLCAIRWSTVRCHDMELEVLQYKLRYKDLEEEFVDAEWRWRDAEEDLVNLKKERKDKFCNFFDRVAEEMNNVFKALYQDRSALALLVPENDEEPYSEGINIGCALPGAFIRPFCNLSYDDRIMVAFALVFAIHSCNPAPFLVMDKNGAGLGGNHANKLTAYILEQRNRLQTIIVPSDDKIYSAANSLIGLCPDDEDYTISKVLPPLDLDEYQQ